MSGNLITLKADNSLLNPNFDGYKLSNTDVRVYSKKLNDGVWLQKAQESFSYLYTRLQTLHNHLFQDPQHPLHAYSFSSRGHLMKYVYCKDSRLSEGEVVWQADMTESRKEGRSEDEETLPKLLPPSLHFPSSNIALVSNGCGKLHILQTDDRSCTSSWLESFVHETASGVLVHSCVQKGEEDVMEVNVLLLSLTMPEQLKNNSLYKCIPKCIMETSTSSVLHVLHWLTFSPSDNTWKLTRERHIAGLGAIEYCSFNKDATDVILLCHDNFYFIYDSLEPVIQEKSEVEKPKTKPDYIFIQNDEDITVWLRVGAVKEEINVKVSAKKLTVIVKEEILLEGDLCKSVDSTVVTWTHKNDQLELSLPKSEEGARWNQLFSESKQVGEELLDSNLIDEVHTRLAHLSPQTWGVSPEQDKPAFNPGQLEACDEASEDLILLQLNGSLHNITQHAQLGATQHLMNIHESDCGSAPSFCLRHDVDGVVWQPEGNTEFTHRSTFHAFGYVRASKSMAKFTRAPSDCSYAAICELRSHLYLFCQQELFGAELRNRKSGKVMNTVSRQLLISLKSHDQVIGMHAAPGVVFVLTSTDIFAYNFMPTDS